MDAHLPAAFATLAGLGAPITHYKMCSTLDSSPEVGSVGRAIDLALAVIPSAWTPVLVAAPPMRRYQAFGNLFASGPGGVSRLDRHPVMARHPVTPMDEADVAAASRAPDRAADRAGDARGPRDPGGGRGGAGGQRRGGRGGDGARLHRRGEPCGLRAADLGGARAARSSRWARRGSNMRSSATGRRRG